jgi:aspartate/methionine/tyrosine aminotransferase
MQKELIREADESGLLIFCDEMYYGLRNQDTPWIPSAADLSDRSIVLSGLSKTYGLPGLRCGWLVVHDTNLRDSIVNWKFYTSICPPVPTEFLAEAALQVAEELRSRNQARIARNLVIAEDFFSRWPQLFKWRRPLAGSTALVGFDVPSVEDLSARLAEQEGILIQSARMLGGDDQHMRLGLGREDFPLALERFESWLCKSDLDSA